MFYGCQSQKKAILGCLLNAAPCVPSLCLPQSGDARPPTPQEGRARRRPSPAAAQTLWCELGRVCKGCSVPVRLRRWDGFADTWEDARLGPARSNPRVAAESRSPRPGPARPRDPAGSGARGRCAASVQREPCPQSGAGGVRMPPHYSSVNIKHHCLTNEEKPLPSE